MKRTLWPGLTIGLVAAQVSSNAWACGGCFHPPTADSVVTGHRMAFAISDTRTVLWDQIQYSGSPSEFGWVLPVKPGATIEASTDAWFEAMDAFTTVQVTAPQLTCATPAGSGFGCGGSSDSSRNGSAGSAELYPGVTVLHEGTVGPYETVTLQSTNTGSLRTWLANHNYVVPPDIDPVIDAYIAEGSDFIALKLVPGAGVDKMTPVRVVTPGGQPFLPLRMVQAGTGSTVDIVLFVIGEQRYGLADLQEAHVDLGSLAFDFTKNDSNYPALRDRALADNNGFSFVTAFALQQPFSTFLTSPSGIPPYFGVGDPGAGTVASDPTLAALYFDQALFDDGRMPSTCPIGGSDPYYLSSDQLVTAVGDPGTLAASDFECSTGAAPYTDLSAALIGMHPGRTWLTRLEMRLPREALTMDCNVAPAEQKVVSSQLLATRASGRPAGCLEPIFQSRMARESVRPRMTVAWGLGLFGALALARRLRRRRAQ